MATTANESGVNPAEAIALSERAWAAWQRRRLVLLGVPGALLVPAVICAVLRDPQPDETDYLGLAMLVFFGLAVAGFIWARMQMPLSPPRVRTLAEQGGLGPAHVERLRRQAGR
jgi:drug/metabolite transporter (DMT)-like permease